MAPISSEEQVKFLVSCIKFSQAGKVDFVEVAKDCGIISAGAAAKRYSRLLKSIDSNSKSDTATGDQEDEGAVDSPKKKRATPVKRKDPAEPKSAKKKSKVTKDDAVTAAENFVETCLEPTTEEADADLYLFGTHSG